MAVCTLRNSWYLIACWGLASLLVAPVASGTDFTCERFVALREVLAQSDVVGVADVLSVGKTPDGKSPGESGNVLITCEFRWVKIIHRSPTTCIEDAPAQTLQFTDSQYGSTYRVGRYLLFVMQCGETVFAPRERTGGWEWRFISDGVYVPPFRRSELLECERTSTNPIVASSGSEGIAQMRDTSDGLKEDDRRIKGGVPLAVVEEAIAALLPPDGEQVFEAVGVRLEKEQLSNVDGNGQYWALHFDTYDLPCKISPPENSTVRLFRFDLEGYCLRSQLETTEDLPVGPDIWVTHFLIAGEWRSGAFMINRITNRHTGEELLRHVEPAASGF
jgi:hypothetical protein